MDKILRMIVEYREYSPVALAVVQLWKSEVANLRGECGKPTVSNLELDPLVKETVLKAATEGRITCPAARELADRLGVDPSVIGQACNQLRIKIKGCALGCF